MKDSEPEPLVLELAEVPRTRAHAQGAGPAPAGSWSVRAIAFRDPVSDADGVAVILGIPLQQAQRLVASAPVVLAAGLDQAEAERLAAALAGMHAKLAVEEKLATVPPSGPPSAPGARLSAPSAPHAVHAPWPMPAEPIPPGRPLRHEPVVSPLPFWSELPVAFVVPLLGRGPLSLALSGVAAAATFLLWIRSFGLLRWLPVLTLGLIHLGFCVDLFTRTAQAAGARTPGKLPAPDGTPGIGDLIARGWAVLGVLAVFVGFGFILEDLEAPAWIFDVVAIVAGVLWPMSLTVQATTGRTLGFFDVPAAVRAIAAAPLEYAAVVAASYALAFALRYAVELSLTQLLLSGTLSSPMTALGGVMFLVTAASTYWHGVIGYAMGALVRARSDRLGFLAA